MRLVFFYPSLLSDWNNPSATPLRGLAMDLILRGHEVVVYEPRHNPHLEPVLQQYGHSAVARFHAAYPGLASRRYDPADVNLDQALAGAQLVVVHDDTDPALRRRLVDHRARCGEYALLYHATHFPAYPAGFDTVLTGGTRLSDRIAGTVPVTPWPAAADTRVFTPAAGSADLPEGDVVWVGSCTDDARLDELQEYLLRPVQRLGLRARVYGAAFSDHARQAIAQAGVQLGGWAPDFELPAIYAAFRVVVLLPPQPNTSCPDPHLLAALACGRPVLAAACDESDLHLRAGRDYAAARDGKELTGWLARLLADRQLAATFGQRGRQAVLAHHAAAQRATTLLGLGQTLPGAHIALWPAAGSGLRAQQSMIN